jgi:hypothetical protein
MQRASYRLCGLLLGLGFVVHGCGDDGGPAAGTTAVDNTGDSSSSSSSSSTGDESSTSTGAADSTTMMPDDDTGTPINCGAQLCAPELICVREETQPGGGSTSTETSTGTGTGTGTDTGTASGGGMGGGGTVEEFFCRGRPDDCTESIADCSCAAVLCPSNSCECIDEGTNAIACVPGPSC